MRSRFFATRVWKSAGAGFVGCGACLRAWSSRHRRPGRRELVPRTTLELPAGVLLPDPAHQDALAIEGVRAELPVVAADVTVLGPPLGGRAVGVHPQVSGLRAVPDGRVRPVLLVEVGDACGGAVVAELAEPVGVCGAGAGTGLSAADDPVRGDAVRAGAGAEPAGEVVGWAVGVAVWRVMGPRSGSALTNRIAAGVFTSAGMRMSAHFWSSAETPSQMFSTGPRSGATRSTRHRAASSAATRS